MWVEPGVVLSKELRLEAGYLWHYVARPGAASDITRHVAAVNLFVTFRPGRGRGLVRVGCAPWDR